MAKFTIYSKDGKSVRHIGEPQFSGSYMGVDYIEFRTISSPTPVTWEIGDYVDYYRTGLRYKLYSLPMPNKVARRGEYGASFEYSNVQFFCATKELEIAPFRDLVPTDNLIHFTTRQDFSTYENVYGIARRLQACMDDIFPGRWVIEVVKTSDEALLSLLEEYKELSFAEQSCHEVLSQIYDNWGNIGWLHSYEQTTGKDIITIGGANVRTSENTSDIYEYGFGKGLTSLKKAATNAEEFATRLYVYGSDRNIQTRHYNQFDIVNKDSVDIRNLMLPLNQWGKTDGVADARKAYLQASDEVIEKYGLIPRTVYFDGNDNEEIYPSITKLTMKDVREMLIANGEGDSEFLPAAKDERIDKVAGTYSSDYGDGSQSDIARNKTFRLALRPFGFDVIAQGRLTNEGYATISMKSGACAGRDFKIRKDTLGRLTDTFGLVGIVYEIEKSWDESLGMGLPNTIYPIKADVEFVLLDIPMPDYYITLAEQRLLEAGRKMLADYTRVSAFYEPSLNPIKIQEVGKRLRAGMYMAVYDDDIIETDDHTDYVLIDTINIDESAQLPQYKVTLREEKRSAKNFSALKYMVEDAKEESKQSIANVKHYTERRFRGAQETVEMLQGAFENYTEGISPVTVQTIAMLVGDESLQFRMIASTGISTLDIGSSVTYMKDSKSMVATEPRRLMHMTLGIDSVSPESSRDLNSYKKWLMPAGTISAVNDPSKAYYIYAQAPKTGNVGKYILSESKKPMDDNNPNGYYYFLVGIVNSEFNEDRSYVELYGFTEILPGRITTDKISSTDGKTYFDLAGNVINVGEKTGFSGTDEYLRMWAGAAYANRFNAPFKVSDSGELIAENATIKGNINAEEGKIGPLNISEDGISITEWPKGLSNGDVFGTVVLFKEQIAFSAMRQNTSTSASSIRSVVVDIASTSEDTAAIVVNSQKTAIKCPTGTFDGLRTKTKVLKNYASEKNPHILTEFDYNILIPSTSGSYHIELPDTPIDGQEYWIETLGGDFYVYSQVRMWSHFSGVYETKHLFSSRGVVRFKYYEEASTWTYSWVESIS